MQLFLLPANDDNITSLACEGNITQALMTSSPDPLEQILGAKGFSRQVLLNLEKTSYIDSSGIGWLLGSHKRFMAAGGRLILHSLPPMVEQVIHLLKLQNLMTIKSDQPAALALAKQAKGQS
jgi:anti-anti-sigma factor